MSSLPMFGDGPFYDGPSMKLYPHQEETYKEIRNTVKSGIKRILVVAPTGAGKTVLFAYIIKNSRVPVLFIAHRMELINQCADKLKAQGVTNIGIIRANDARSNPFSSVQIASIQTLRKRALPEAGLIIIDEAHLAASQSYKDVLNQFPAAISLGFTATPARLDNKPLSDIYDHIVPMSHYSKLIEQRYIEAPICYSAKRIPDVSKVKITNGDYNETELAQVMSDRVIVGDLVEHWLKYASDRSTFIFAVNISHSKIIESRFKEAGVRIAHLDGDTPESERLSILSKFESGELQAVTNCNVLLEGVDIRRAKCVVHARPTRSLVLYMQSVGRILRPWNDVKPILLDHAGNFLRHGAPHEDRTWSLTKEVGERPKILPHRVCPACFAYVPIHVDACPYCNEPFVVENTTGPSYIEVGGSLQQMDSTPIGIRRQFYDNQVIVSRTVGYAPGYAAVQYLKEYKCKAPWMWREETRNIYINDAQWVARHEYRRKLRGDEDKIAFMRKLNGDEKD